MAGIPAAPQENAGVGDKILFTVYDNGGGNNAAAVFRAFFQAALNSAELADLGVYPTSGKLLNFGYTLGSGSAEQIHSANAPCQGALIKAPSTNSATVYVGTSTVAATYGATHSGYPLDPGDSVGVPCRNASEIYLIGTTGDKVNVVISSDV